MNPESRSGESAQGEFRLADDLCKVTSKARRCILKRQFAKGVQKNITDILKAWITTDSITSSSYSLLHLQNSERRFQELCFSLQLFTYSIAL